MMSEDHIHRELKRGGGGGGGKGKGGKGGDDGGASGSGGLGDAGKRSFILSAEVGYFFLSILGAVIIYHLSVHIF
jgi:hypothetical protein